MPHVYKMSRVPTATEYVAGFSKINISPIQLLILRAQYAAPEHTATASELAEAAGISGHPVVNVQYGRLGRILCNAMGFEPSKREIGTFRWWAVLSSGWSLGRGRFVWQMLPEVAEALEYLGWVDSIGSVRLPEEVSESAKFIEGAVCRVHVNAYERNAAARAKCIEHFGHVCSVCGFDFGMVYGPPGAGLIHVHHLRPLSEIGEEYEVDPIRDLRPVCPNCHAVIHRRHPPYDIEEVRQFVIRRTGAGA